MESFTTVISSEEHTRFTNHGPEKLNYGTAGFRGRAEDLERVLFRVGILAALRSKVVDGTSNDEFLHCLS